MLRMMNLARDSKVWGRLNAFLALASVIGIIACGGGGGNFEGSSGGPPPPPSPGSAGWTKSGSNPVLSEGASGAWDDDFVDSPSVIKAGPASYQMWYTGAKVSTGTQKIGLATSTDGVAWAKSASNPVLSTGAATAFDEVG